MDFLFLLSEFYYLLFLLTITILLAVNYYIYKINCIQNCYFIVSYGVVLYLLLVISDIFLNASILTFHMSLELFSLSIKLISIFILLSVLWLFLLWFKQINELFVEPWVLLLSFFFIVFIILPVNDFFLLFLLIEIVSIISYTLACLNKFSLYSTEASLKYFILGAMASGLLAFGIVLLYGFFGLTNFVDFKLFFNIIAENNFLYYGYIISFIFILSGLLFKLSLVPFHIWVPDVFEGLTPAIAFLFGTMSKIIFFFILCKILFLIFLPLAWLWKPILLLIGFISVLLGSVGGLLQNNFYRLYAYSAIVNAGLLICFVSVFTIESIAFLFNYFFIYILTSLSFFFVLSSLYRCKNLKLRGINFFKDYIGFVETNFFIGLVLCLALFSLAGIPPISGFLGKFFLFILLYKELNLWGFLIFLLLLTVIAAFFYIRIIYYLFFFNTSFISFNNLSSFSIELVSVILFWTFLGYIFFQPLVLLILQSLSYLFFLV